MSGDTRSSRDLHEAVEALELGPRLHVMRKAKGHTQGELATWLENRGTRKIHQSQISDLERGRKADPAQDLQDALDAYTADWADVDLDLLASRLARLNGSDAERSPRTDLVWPDSGGEASNASTLPPLADRSASEPTLGPRQADLLGAFTQRLAAGPPLSDADAATFRLSAVLLGLLSE